ncbi:MAG: diguanylate cyclase [Deinococcota bacterium]
MTQPQAQLAPLARPHPKGDILVVDDVAANLKILNSLLSEHGYKVRPVTSGAHALTAVGASLPDLILLDIRMPDMDGFEVCRQLKADSISQAVPIIFISAFDDVTSKVTSFELGGVDYITKPFEEAEVIARVSTHVSLYRLRLKLHQQLLALEDANARIKELSIRDELTGLYNRRHFNEAALQAFSAAQRYAKPLTVVIGDIDFFKRVNDTFSHAIGDDVLKTVARLLTQERREADIVARYGGEEFVIALPETLLENGRQACEVLRQRIEAYPWEAVAPGLTITMSMGLCADTSLSSLEEMLNCADKKLYEAKAAGRNNVQY